MLDRFNSEDFIVFSTRDYANAEGLSLSAASRRLATLANKKLLSRLTKGIWANTTHPWFTPLACVPHLLGCEQGYVSFLTALHLHGLLSQIPTTVQIATTGHTRKLDTAWGRFEFIQIKPELMQEGTEWSQTRLPYLMATPEKALLDTLYIATRKGNRFASLPELTLEHPHYDRRRFRRLLKALPYADKLRTAVTAREARLTGNTSS